MLLLVISAFLSTFSKKLLNVNQSEIIILKKWEIIQVKAFRSNIELESIVSRESKENRKIDINQSKFLHYFTQNDYYPTWQGSFEFCWTQAFENQVHEKINDLPFTETAHFVLIEVKMREIAFHSVVFMRVVACLKGK